MLQGKLSDVGANFKDVLEVWKLPVHALCIISNRETCLHRDMFGRIDCLDMLIALGEYKDGRMELPGLGLRLLYDPGCLLAFSGRLFRHGSFCKPNRACIAYYIREKIFDRLSENNPSGFASIGKFLKLGVIREAPQ